MLDLTHIAMREIRVALKARFRISSGATQERRVLLLRLTDRDGTESWSECVAGETPHYSPETIDTCALAIREWIAPRVLGRRFPSPAELSATLDAAIRGHYMAKAAVEMGTWALEAARRGIALAELVGGQRETVATGISLGIQESPDALVAQACDARRQGYRRVKLKIQPGADVEYVAAVRTALGPDALLTVDANCAYRLEDLQLLRRLDDYDLVLLEQPLAHDDLVRHAELQRQLTTPLCLDESITGPDRAQDMIALGSGRIINIKPARVGGFTRAIAIHDLAARHGMPVWCGGMLETGIGRAYNVALASLDNFSLPGDLSPSSRYWHRDIVAPEWTMADGMVTVPRHRPGLGVEVDLDYLDEVTVRETTLAP